MKLLVTLASRANPEGLMATIASLNGLRSGKHEIKIKIGIDNDDAPSLAYTPTIKHVYPNVEFIVVERKPTLGEIQNELARNEDADVYLPLTDRMVVCTPLWDEIIGNASLHFWNHMLWWQTIEGAIMPIITRKWYEAYRQVFTEYFPFWFDDTWLAEINSFLSGSAGHGLPVQLWRKPNGKTKRMHDLRFWQKFFIAKRPERMEVAEKLRVALRLPELPDTIKTKLTAETQMRDAFWERDCARQEKVYGDISKPDFTYQEAYRQALAFIEPTDENIARASGGIGE